MLGISGPEPKAFVQKNLIGFREDECRKRDFQVIKINKLRNVLE